MMCFSVCFELFVFIRLKFDFAACVVVYFVLFLLFKTFVSVYCFTCWLSHDGFASLGFVGVVLDVLIA